MGRAVPGFRQGGITRSKRVSSNIERGVKVRKTRKGGGFSRAKPAGSKVKEQKKVKPARNTRWG